MSEVQIKSVKPRHEAIAQWIIAHPQEAMGACAEHFNVTRAWLSVIVNSSIFRARLAELNELVIDEVVVPLREKLHGVAHLAVERLGEQVEKSVDGKFLLNVADKTLHRLDFGHSPIQSPGAVSNTQNNFYTVPPELLAEVREKRKAQAVAQDAPAPKLSYQAVDPRETGNMLATHKPSPEAERLSFETLIDDIQAPGLPKKL